MTTLSIFNSVNYSILRDFINNSISVRQLSNSMELRELNKQIVIVSKQAFRRLQFEVYKPLF